MRWKISGKFAFWGVLAALGLLIAIISSFYVHAGEEATALRATILSSSELAQRCKTRGSFILNGGFFAYRSDRADEFELDYSFKCDATWGQATGKYITTEIGWRLKTVEVTIGKERFVLTPRVAQPKTKS